jgi:conjugative relaxase-like TrwC/TraI family protein
MTVSYRKATANKLGYYKSALEDPSVTTAPCAETRAQWWIGGDGSAALEGSLGIRSGTPLEPIGIQKLTQLADGFGPEAASRIALVRNAGSERRVALHDFTLSAPKSVSVAWALAGTTLSAAMEAAHLHAARSFLSVMADQIHSRLGAGGRIRRPCPVVAVLFPHQTSRALDPQLHIHCVVLNVTVMPTGRGAAIEVRRALNWIGAAACVYHAELARRLRILGFAIRRSGMIFELEEVPESLVWEFSQRRREVLRALDEQASARDMDPQRAIVTRRQVEVQVLRTRPKKSMRASPVLRRWWRMRAGRQLGPAPLDAWVEQLGLRRNAVVRSSSRMKGFGAPPLDVSATARCASTPHDLKELTVGVLRSVCAPVDDVPGVHLGVELSRGHVHGASSPTLGTASQGWTVSTSSPVQSVRQSFN